MAAIRQHAEVALAHPSRAQTVELAEAVHTEGLRIQRLIDDLLRLVGPRLSAPTWTFRFA